MGWGSRVPQPPSVRRGSLRASSDAQWVRGTLASASGLSWDSLGQSPLGDGHTLLGSLLVAHPPQVPTPRVSLSVLREQEEMPVCE